MKGMTIEVRPLDINLGLELFEATKQLQRVLASAKLPSQMPLQKVVEVESARASVARATEAINDEIILSARARAPRSVIDLCLEKYLQMQHAQ